MAHKVQHTGTSSVGLENSIRGSWTAGDKVKILSSNQWLSAHIVTIHKNWLYCLLEDGDTKKIDRYDVSVQPYGTGTNTGGEDDEEEFWMKDNFASTDSVTDGLSIPMNGQSVSLGFNTLKSIQSDFNSTSIVQNPNNIIDSLLSPTTKHRESVKKVANIGNVLTDEQKQFQQMCGYTIWVQWCDSSELHGYYQCVGLRNNQYHFRHRRDNLAELFADDKGYWYLMYDGKILYKSKRKSKNDPPPRNWKCIEGSLPPPGVSQVALPDDSTPMVLFDEEKKLQNDALFFGTNYEQQQDDDDGTASNISGVSRQTTVKHTTAASLMTPKAGGKHGKKKSKSGKKKKSKKNKLNMAKLLMDEFEVAIDVLDFNFDGSKQVAFHLNIGRHMEVTKCKENGQAEKLGVLQGDILLKIDEEDISKNWEKATNLLRSKVQNKEKFTITFVRRKVENLIITVVRAGNNEYNGKYKFYKRDKEDDMCPIYVKNDHDEDFDFTGIDGVNGNKFDPLTSDSDSIHIIQRVYANPENSEALWVLKNGKDEHFYMCVTTEYLPPQHGWELVPDSEAKYPAPGLQFTSAANKFDHVNRLRGYSTKQNVMNDGADNDDLKSDDNINKIENVHDALNINNRNRTNKHRHEKTLTRMRATLGSANEFNNAAKSSNQRSHTGGASGYMPPKPGMGYAGGMGMGKKGGFGSRLFGGGKKKPKVAVASAYPPAKSPKSDDGNESAPETDEDTAKIEAIWKQKLEQTTKNAINQLETKHADEIKEKEDKVTNLNQTVENLRNSLSESSEYYYQLYINKCELSLVLQEKQVELAKSKAKQKEMGKRYFQQQQRTEELETKLNEISQTFSSRMSAIQSKPKKHRPTKSTVNDLASIEQQFRDLLSSESTSSSNKDGLNIGGGDDDGGKAQYLENEMIKMREKMNENEKKMIEMQKQNETLKQQNSNLQNQLLSKQGGADQYYQDRANKLKTKVSVFQQNIYNLMSLLQNVEQEYMQKCGKLPKVTKAIDWRNEYDPKKYKIKNSGHSINQSTTNNVNMNGTHPTNDTFVINKNIKKHNKKDKKNKKSKHNADGSATYSMTLPTEQRFAGFDLGGSGDEHEQQQPKQNQYNRPKPKHRGNKNNESRIIDL